MEHFACAFAVNVFPILEHINAPLLPSKEAEYPGFDSREISNNVFVTGLGDKRRSNQFREDIGNIVVEQFQSVKIAVTDEGAGFRQIVHMVLG